MKVTRSKLPYVKKACVTSLLLIICHLPLSAQFSNWHRTYSYKTYRTAITLSNPLSAGSKAGSGVEHRLGNFAYMASYYAYRGAYPGLMTDLDLRFYSRRHWMHSVTKFEANSFVYTRGYMGIAGFNSDKLGFMAYPKHIYWNEKLYIGQAIGLGKRYSKGMFFFTVKTGLRVTSFFIDPIEPEVKHLYKLFYLTGPGSIAEVNFQFGIQY